jgi:hypothetical protein
MNLRRVNKMFRQFKFVFLKLIFWGVVYFACASAVSRSGVEVFKGKIRNMGAESEKFLKYIPDSKDPRGFRLMVLRDIRDASVFSVEFTKLLCRSGENLQQDFFGSVGEYYVANIKTPDNKYLVYDEDKKSLKLVDKIPKPQFANYAWMMFHHIQLDEYFFYPFLNKSLMLQKFAIPDDVDVLPLYGEKTSGRDFIYWKFIKE